ncbi:MAG: hypothetical protein K9N21_22645 [Deltaproteobacteria bacterium]|nr:hypothetical protein [Deltaproteobacteria bacterium]
MKIPVSASGLAISAFLCFGLLMLVSGCSPVEIRADYLQTGFDYHNLGYTALPESSPLNKTMAIKNLRINIVGREDQYQPRRITYDNDSPGQPMEPSHEIWVVGKKLKGKIILNQVVLGNELKHLMHSIDSEVACPCNIEDLEACVATHPPERCKQLP